MEKSGAVCTRPQVHGRTIKAAEMNMPTKEMIHDLAEQFRILGDGTRLRVLWALSQGEMCVCDLADVLGCSPSAVSHQLRVLRQAHLIRYDKKGKSSVYMLDDDHVEQILRLGSAHVTEKRRGGTIE